jgi:hypothetical protein
MDILLILYTERHARTHAHTHTHACARTFIQQCCFVQNWTIVGVMLYEIVVYNQHFRHHYSHQHEYCGSVRVWNLIFLWNKYKYNVLNCKSLLSCIKRRYLYQIISLKLMVCQGLVRLDRWMKIPCKSFVNYVCPVHVVTDNHARFSVVIFFKLQTIVYSLQWTPSRCTVYLQLISSINLYMFQACRLCLIRVYSLYMYSSWHVLQV